jgi:hypothetical protein
LVLREVDEEDTDAAKHQQEHREEESHATHELQE